MSVASLLSHWKQQQDGQPQQGALRAETPIKPVGFRTLTGVPNKSRIEAFLRQQVAAPLGINLREDSKSYFHCPRTRAHFCLFWSEDENGLRRTYYISVHFEAPIRVVMSASITGQHTDIKLSRLSDEQAVAEAFWSAYQTALRYPHWYVPGVYDTGGY